jgi:hypothetical protein
VPKCEIQIRATDARRLLVVAVAALALSACAQRSQIPVSSLGEDDDAFCRAGNVAAGSPPYVACRKDRDVLRSNANARTDRRQRDLGEYMMNHPDHP